jgi:dTDP-4-amino-4,6-dideoxygalactose transaminase
MNRKIFLSPPHMTGEEMDYIKNAIESNWVAPVGPHVDAFESELASLLNVNHVVVVNSGTSAIHLGLLALGVGAGDEVICPTLTFCATVNPILYCGAQPVFVDSEAETWNIDPGLLEEAIVDRIKKKKKPKVIIVVHLFGMPAQMNKILTISQQYDIPVLEDAAEALGSIYYGKPLGTLGIAGILSFNGNKIITTSGGGAFVTNNSMLAERVKYLRQEAKEPLPYYEHNEVGFNYRLSNISAAIGRAQLKALNSRVTKRRHTYSVYKENLKKKSMISFQEQADEGYYTNRWLTAILIQEASGKTNESVRLSLEIQNIESRFVWKPMHLQPVYKGYPAYGKIVSEKLFSSGLCLPSGTDLSNQDLKEIINFI